MFGGVLKSVVVLRKRSEEKCSERRISSTDFGVSKVRFRSGVRQNGHDGRIVRADRRMQGGVFRHGMLIIQRRAEPEGETFDEKEKRRFLERTELKFAPDRV